MSETSFEDASKALSNVVINNKLKDHGIIKVQFTMISYTETGLFEDSMLMQCFMAETENSVI